MQLTPFMCLAAVGCLAPSEFLAFEVDFGQPPPHAPLSRDPLSPSLCLCFLPISPPVDFVPPVFHLPYRDGRTTWYDTVLQVTVVVGDTDGPNERRFFWHLVEDRASFPGGSMNYAEYMQQINRQSVGGMAM